MPIEELLKMYGYVANEAGEAGGGAGVEALVLHGDVGQPQLAGDGAAGVRHGAGDVHQHLQLRCLYYTTRVSECSCI